MTLMPEATVPPGPKSRNESSPRGAGGPAVSVPIEIGPVPNRGYIRIQVFQYYVRIDPTEALTCAPEELFIKVYRPILRFLLVLGGIPYY